MTSPAPRLWLVDNPAPIDYDALLVIIRMGQAGTLTTQETRTRLRQVIA